MQPVKQDAIVLGGVDYSDSSRVIWVLTPDFGRQSLMVKGARRAKSQFQGSLETFSRVSLIYRRSLGGSMPTLREVDVICQWNGIRASLDAFMAASEAVEAIKVVCEEEQESRDIFDLLEAFLVFSDTHGQAPERLRPALLAFRWRLAALLGVSPQLLDCARCGRPIERRPRYRFLVAEGGLLCPECEDVPGHPDHAPEGGLDYASLRFVYRSLRRFPAPGEEPPELAAESLADLERLTRRYLSYHLGEHRTFQGTASPPDRGNTARKEKPDDRDSQSEY